MRLVVLALPSGDVLDGFDNSIDLVLRRVTGTPQTHQAVGGLTEAVGNGLGVEVAVRGEDALARTLATLRFFHDSLRMFYEVIALRSKVAAIEPNRPAALR